MNFISTGTKEIALKNHNTVISVHDDNTTAKKLCNRHLNSFIYMLRTSVNMPKKMTTIFVIGMNDRE